MLLGPAQSKIVTTPFERQPHFISESVEAQFHAMHAASRAEPPSSRQERKERLRALYDAILAAKGEFQEAIASDFGWRSHGETLLAEVIPSLTAVVEAVRKVGKLE